MGAFCVVVGTLLSRVALVVCTYALHVYLYSPAGQERFLVTLVWYPWLQGSAKRYPWGPPFAGPFSAAGKRPPKITGKGEAQQSGVALWPAVLWPYPGRWLVRVVGPKTRSGHGRCCWGVCLSAVTWLCSHIPDVCGVESLFMSACAGRSSYMQSRARDCGRSLLECLVP